MQSVRAGGRIEVVCSSAHARDCKGCHACHFVWCCAVPTVILQAPPDHTRRDSWELAWEDDEQQQAAHSAGLGGSLIHHSTSPAPALGTGVLSPESARPQGRGLYGTASPAAATGAASTGATGVSQAGVGKARPLAPGMTGGTRVSGSGAVEMASAPHQKAPAAAPAMVLPSVSDASRQQQQQRDRTQDPPEVAASSKADAVARMLAAEAAQVRQEGVEIVCGGGGQQC